ncbi:hypothetical protein [Phytoactinopolyspora halotolerans]|uniref:Rpn family recombination-promoting nuclease/putative transposase n=1 Tax=Phytoactinopolyspora halotolerans TaxID=1981512 RepID=A0A6L9S3U2_9ACTN|nr:hypothetical protein [Phytoactinopolyspora halotolerans]NEE00115.1 hypothetical protein [Phytoactinopolyspora halotolerans]
MPSALHESLIEMFRQRPSFAAELLDAALDVAVPPYDRVDVASGHLPTLAPAELRADAVLTYTKMSAGHGDSPALAVIVEVQLREDEGKKKSWPRYVANLHARHDCPVVLLVLCPNHTTAAWARSPINLGPGSVITPFVVGPDVVPVITDTAQARGQPELAVLSALTHGRDPRHRSVLSAVASALTIFDSEHALLYADIMLAALPDEARRHLEAHMAVYDIRKPQSEYFRRQRDEVLAEGRAEGEAQSILRVLAARGVDVDEDARARIITCTDPKQLETWIDRAATAETIDDLFV